MKRRLIVVLVVSSALSAPVLAADGATTLLGDESDGSRAQPIHLIPLYAENEKGGKGTQIDPNDPLADATLVNDLDLKVIDPNGNETLPYVLDGKNPAQPANRCTRISLRRSMRVSPRAAFPTLSLPTAPTRA